MTVRCDCYRVYDTRTMKTTRSIPRRRTSGPSDSPAEFREKRGLVEVTPVEGDGATPGVIAHVRLERAIESVNRFRQDRKWILAHERRQFRRRTVVSVVTVESVEPVGRTVKVVFGPDETVVVRGLRLGGDGLRFPGAPDRVTGTDRPNVLGEGLSVRHRIVPVVVDDEQFPFGFQLCSDLVTGVGPGDRREEDTRRRVCLSVRHPYSEREHGCG